MNFNYENGTQKCALFRAGCSEPKGAKTGEHAKAWYDCIRTYRNKTEGKFIIIRCLYS